MNPNPEGNAIRSAQTPVFDYLIKNFPNSTLITHGEAVGLPEGQMGNSEVGHLNIGAGRVVEQWLLRINRALSGNFLDSCKTYIEFRNQALKSTAMHLVGLFSDGGVHSHLEHLYLMLKRLKHDFSGEIYLHLITDGRDTSPNAAINYLEKLEEFIKEESRIKIATVLGRFYAMDRDKRWERTETAASAIMLSQGKYVTDLKAAINDSYKSGHTDEFIEPLVLNKRPVSAGDCLLFWNFREDRMRQISEALSRQNFDGFSRDYRHLPKEQILCFTAYDHTLELPFIFENLAIENHLGAWISKKGLKQIRIAETEKYPHVTYFFNAGIEKAYAGEDRKLLPSPRDVKTYDLKPEMSAAAVCDAVLQAINSAKYDLVVVNFANCDMVGHTGVFAAAVKAVETVDKCLGKIIEALQRTGGKALIIADHGNAEQMINYEDGSPHTAHTKFPVPAILFGYDINTAVKGGASLQDVAPTILKMLGLEPPAEMTGKAIF